MNNELASAAATAPEVDLTTFGRKSGRPSRNTIWVTTDEQGRIHIRSGRGLEGDWPQNLLANGRAILHIYGPRFRRPGATCHRPRWVACEPRCRQGQIRPRGTPVSARPTADAARTGDIRARICWASISISRTRAPQ